VLTYLSLYIVFIGINTLLFTELPPENRIVFSNVISNGILIGLVIVFLISGLVKKQNVYEEFIDGAKDGFKIAVQIIPYLIAMLVAIGVFRISGGLECHASCYKSRVFREDSEKYRTEAVDKC
jgi:hypothetical protein